MKCLLFLRVWNRACELILSSSYFLCFCARIDILLVDENCVSEQAVFNCLLLALHLEIAFISPSLFLSKWQFIYKTLWLREFGQLGCVGGMP